MPNTDNPHGFALIGRTQGGGSIELEEFDKDASESSAIFPNDLCHQQADGNIAPGGTPGTTIYTGVSMNYGAADTLTKHLLAAQPDALFEAQDNDDSTGLLAVDMGQNANAVFGAGDAVRIKSGHEINISGHAATATLDLRLLRLHKAVDNAFGPHARIEVLINKHTRAYGAAGI